MLSLSSQQPAGSIRHGRSRRHSKRSRIDFAAVKGASVDKVRLGNIDVVVGQRLQPLTDSTDLYRRGDFLGLRERLDRDGFLFVRGVISADIVGAARDALTSFLFAKGVVASANSAAMKVDTNGKTAPGWTVDAGTGGFVGGREDDSAIDAWRELTTSETVARVYSAAELKTFYRSLFAAENVTTFPECTWLRVRGAGDVTAEHTDYYYFKKATSIIADHTRRRNDDAATCTTCRTHIDAVTDAVAVCALCAQRLHRACITPRMRSQSGEFHCAECANSAFPYYTTWIPLHDVTINDGRLALIAGSHRLRGYDDSRNELLPSEYDAAAAKSAIWQSADMSAGDVIVFNIKTVHAAAKNTSARYRLSLDTRMTAQLTATDTTKKRRRAL